ncbi:lanthionine synthetase C family protein [Clostridium sp. JS66]|uniref:lanthionine synthetase C family protein n=1 Tax=Clostridium sp. JS66 TaxID=3064705 RepID=UPI00298D6C26|nr:lanthionine synthetase C family protein [Clostridium sp. JS66]WPC44137.1 lanthionine synthetase C family protein [Clostridium sp. JS66]
MKMKNVKLITSKEIENSEVELVKFALERIMEKMKYPEKLNNDLINMKVNPIFMYPSICMLLGESKELLNDEIDWDDVSYKYMLYIKNGIESGHLRLTSSLFSGLAGVGFGVYSLYKSTSHYKKFIDSLNEVIINETLDLINNMNLNDLHMSTYDTISGLSGITGYLLLFKEETKIKKCIEVILEALISITKDREVFGERVAGWHISSKNQFLEQEKVMYKKGNFNLGISHGITGVLGILSIALKEGVEIEGHKNAINRILIDLKKYLYIDENGYIYWPPTIKFEDYIVGNCEIHKSRASWCYGTPGIARTMYLAGKMVNDIESMNIGIKAIEGLCNMKDEDWMLDSPTMCHGYAGLLTVIQAMYLDTNKLIFDIGRKRLLKIILSFYSDDARFVFHNIDFDHPYSEKSKLVKKDDISLLEGTCGILLSLLLFFKPITTNWMRHFLIN